MRIYMPIKACFVLCVQRNNHPKKGHGILFANEKDVMFMQITAMVMTVALFE